MKRIEDLQAIIDLGVVKFSEPQQRIVDKLLQGDKIVIVNQHRMNGGEYMWKEVESEYLKPAGHVYKAFWGIQYAIKEQAGLDVSMDIFFTN